MGFLKTLLLLMLILQSTKVYTAVVPMWEQLGFENPIYNNPNSLIIGII